MKSQIKKRLIKKDEMVGNKEGEGRTNKSQR
jgi:hypothetical protein